MLQTSCAQGSRKKSILLARLALSCVILVGFVPNSTAFGPKLDPRLGVNPYSETNSPGTLAVFIQPSLYLLSRREGLGKGTAIESASPGYLCRNPHLVLTVPDCTPVMRQFSTATPARRARPRVQFSRTLAAGCACRGSQALVGNGRVLKGVVRSNREQLLFPECSCGGSVGFSVCGVVDVAEFLSKLAKVKSDHAPAEM